MPSPEQVVREFCERMPEKDLGRLRPLLADHVVYHNMPLEPAVGLAATLEAIDAFFTMFERIEFRIVAIAASGPVVLTERVDVLATAEREGSLPVMGAFEVDGGKITAWRDYFDMGQVTAMLSGSAAG